MKEYESSRQLNQNGEIKAVNINVPAFYKIKESLIKPGTIGDNLKADYVYLEILRDQMAFKLAYNHQEYDVIVVDDGTDILRAYCYKDDVDMVRLAEYYGGETVPAYNNMCAIFKVEDWAAKQIVA